MRKGIFLLVLPLVSVAAPNRSPGVIRALTGRQDGVSPGYHPSESDAEPHEHSDIHSASANSDAAHDHHGDDDDETAVVGHHHHQSDPRPGVHTAWQKASAAEAAHYAAAHHHAHGSHAPPRVVLNDTLVHHFHTFPPSYLAADFRLDEDSAIFGEEFVEDWTGTAEDAQEGTVTGRDSGRMGLMVVHVVAMSLAYFGALPIALALRAADHTAHHLANVVFLGIASVGWVAGAWYKSATPDRYIGESHSGLGNMLVLLSLGLALLDSLGLLRRAAVWYRRTPKGERSRKAFIREVLAGSVDGAVISDHDEGYHRALDSIPQREVDRVSHELYADQPGSHGEVMFAIGDDASDDGDDDFTHSEADRHTNRASGVHERFPSNGRKRFSTGSAQSSGSDHTLHNSPMSGTPPPVGYPFAGNVAGHRSKRPLEMGAYDMPAPDVRAAERFGDGYDADAARLHGQPGVELGHEDEDEVWDKTGSSGRRMSAQRFGEVCLTWVRRSQVVLAYVTVLSGVAIYTGMCRASFLPSCLAHYIKGSIFFGYGVLTFARYLGAYADMGWSWNRAPAGSKSRANGPSAEMVECAVIFAYGITNTWMERFGAHEGDPYTVKQVQHISIAVMFWFAGLGGVLLESRTIRRVLGSAVGGTSSKQPASYAFSFNPLPALVIAVTGLAMAAHHQDYVFQVEIHSLWGVLLAGGSLFRMLTYMFLWLRPPVDSTLPSRPPTEILTAFGWATGGIVFILSSEEVTYAAMRAGYDDVMAFLNVTVALTALIFCWEVVVLAVKGWAVLRVRVGRRVDAEI